MTLLNSVHIHAPAFLPGRNAPVWVPAIFGQRSSLAGIYSSDILSV